MGNAMTAAPRLRRGGLLLVASGIAMVWAGCQGVLLTYKGATVPDAYRIALVDGGQRSGRYESPDLTVDYSAVRNGNELRLSGVVEYTAKIRHGFGTIPYFKMSALLTDRDGTVLEDRAIRTPGSDDPQNRMRFGEKIHLPQGTTNMAFSYSFEARGFDGSETSSLWGIPIVR